MADPLSPRQRDALLALNAFIERTGRTPTGPELAARLGLKHFASAYQHLRALERKGYLSLERPDGSRQLHIRLLSPARAMLRTGWPLLGTIPAGPLSDVVSDDTIIVEEVTDLLPAIRPGDFFLEVDGDSMIEAGLEPGMWVVVRPTPAPAPGSICAVWVDGEGGTLKRVYPEVLGVRLEPENPDYESRWVPADQVRIQGAVIMALAVRSFS